MAGVVAVFDFDKTIVDCDSDNWVVDELGFTSRFDQLLNTLPWNALMDELMGEMHSSGVGIEQIAKVLRRIPIHPRVVPAIRATHAFGCDLRIVSDANTFFIDTILEQLGIRELFSEINTNPGFVEESGRLRILPYHDSTIRPHGCGLCPPNMCKGSILERIRATTSADDKKRFIYLGDGAGDYCPTLRVRESDFAMPRKDFPLWELMLKNTPLIKAKVHEWTDGQDLEMVLLGIVRRIILDQDDEDRTRSTSSCGQRNQPSSASAVADCKLGMIVGDAARGTLHQAQALPVPH
ncbi:hypothetical protein MLD38_004839 [Melastoma candidum]|uniref:Uncharacterized protein n=1 Tax=Melastoma candidum TaxID=119954 RepID=A0ACB9S6V4_9MYRT|nr:hypothetical protein MLD38_004839 [Melastoma candidum]